MPEENQTNSAMAVSNDCLMKLRITFAVIGILVGLSVFFVFGLRYENWNCAAWGLTSGVVAVVVLFVHITYYREKWNGHTHTLRQLMLSGCFVQLLGVVGFTVYLALAISQKQGLVIHGEGYYLTLVWCFMTWKWGFFLFYYSRLYRCHTCNVYTILPKDEQ